MQATKAMEQRSQSHDTDSHHDSKSRSQHATLDTRYGRIGISAVAAAVSQKGETKPRTPANSNHALRYERE